MVFRFKMSILHEFILHKRRQINIYTKTAKDQLRQIESIVARGDLKIINRLTNKKMKGIKYRKFVSINKKIRDLRHQTLINKSQQHLESFHATITRIDTAGTISHNNDSYQSMEGTKI